MPPSPIHILGAGNVGAHLAFALRSLPAPTPAVTLLLRPAIFATFNGRITLTTPTAPARSLPFPAEPSVPVPASTIINTLIIATKAHQVHPALAPLLPILSPTATILLLQNGVPDPIPGFGPCFAGVTTHGIYSRAPFDLVLAGSGELVFGRIDGGGGEGGEELITALQRIGAEYTTPGLLRRRQMIKLAVNASINTVTAVYGVRNGALREMPEALETMGRIVDEVFEVVSRSPGGEGLSRKELWREVERMARVTARNWSSMVQDIRAGRRTEVEAITGWVVQRGKEVGVECPANLEVMERVRELEKV